MKRWAYCVWPLVWAWGLGNGPEAETFCRDIVGNVSGLPGKQNPVGGRCLYDPFGRMTGQWGVFVAQYRDRFGGC